eukprot:g5763.t1
MASTTAKDRTDAAARDRAYLEGKGISRLTQDFFDDLFQREELPANPYPDLVRRFRIEEDACGLFRSLEDDAKVYAGMENNVARSPELSGVTYVQAVLNANESYLRADAHEMERHGEDSHVNAWVALTGSAALAGRLFREFWADVQLAVTLEIVTKNLQLAVDLFAQTILAEAKRCQGSNQLLLQRIVIDYPLRHEGSNGGRERTVWTPRQLHDTPDAFISEIKTSLPFRPSVVTTYLFMSPKGTLRTVGGPIISVQRSYTMHYRNSTKANTALTNQPFHSLYGGVFLSGAEAKHYADLFRTAGLSFPVEGVAAAKEYLATNVERAREIGDTLSMHAALLPLALLSGVVEDGSSAGRAVVDVSRVMKSAAARHRSLRNWCDSILLIVGLLAEWAQASQPILKWDEASPVDDDSEEGEDDGHWNRKTRCRSSKDLFQTWLRTAHLLFWGWRRDVLRYLDEDRHSDVAAVKDNVRDWIEEISSTARMGLRLPTLRWHSHGRTVADGKAAFLEAAALARQRLSSLSAWLHCLDLSLAWDAARVCDRVHAKHVKQHSKIEVAAPQGGWPNLLGFQLSGGGAQARGTTSPLPTTAGLLQLQRCWLDDAVAATHLRDAEADQKNVDKRRSRRRAKPSAASTAATAEAAVASGIRYVPAPAAPDSTKTPEGLDVRQAVLETLREDVVPEAFAHEMTLMKYTADNGVDKSLHTCFNDLLTSVLTPNPFPVLTDALAVSSMSLVLRRTVDSRDIAPPALKLVGGGGEESQVFVARGTQKGKGASLYGSKPALTDIDVDATVSLFQFVPPVAGWVLDELGDSCIDVDVGISGCPQQHGMYVHHAVPSSLTVLLACDCEFDLDSGTTPMEHFTRCAVRSATAAHKKSALLVIGLTARTSFFEDHNATPPADGPAGGERFLLQQVLSEPEEVEDGLTSLDPEEIVLEALVPFPSPTGEEALVPMSIRFILVSGTGDDDGGCSEASTAAMFYGCVFSTARAAENVAARHAALTEGLDLPESHIERTRRRVLESLEKRHFLETYRLVHYLRRLRSIVPENDSVPSSPYSEEAAPSQQEYDITSRGGAWRAPALGRGTGPEDAGGVTMALKRMIKGPAGRLDHARWLLSVLRQVVASGGLPPEVLALLDGRSVREHARYCISYLLDALTEQTLVRLEGAIHSIKLRARLLVDRVAEMTATGKNLSNAAARPAGSDATQESACDLVGAVVAMLEIVQLAVESDTHRCCPEIEPVLDRFRRVDLGVDRRTGIKTPPPGVADQGGRRAMSAGSRDSSTPTKARKPSRAAGVRRR